MLLWVQRFYVSKADKALLKRAIDNKDQSSTP